MTSSDPYIGNFGEWKDVQNDFQMTEPEPDCVAVAAYSQEGYEGDALVVYRKGHLWYEQEGSHCSCYGLEGQWCAVDESDGLTTQQALEHFAECMVTTYRDSRKEWLRVAIENIQKEDISIDPAALDDVPKMIEAMRDLAQQAQLINGAIEAVEGDLLNLKNQKKDMVEQYRALEENVKRMMKGG